VTIREEMEPGSAGKAVCVARAKTVAGYDYKGIPASGDKLTRWRPFAAQAEAGNVDVLRAPWNREWFDELASAPCSAHDDQADSAAGAFTELALGKHGGGAVRLAGW
jgi:predicted phage terminase large subunit-like protein